MKASISQNQLCAVAFVMMLSPALRFFPTTAARYAGRAAWLCALLAFLPAAGYLFLARRVLARRAEGEGLCGLIARAVPGRGGRMALLVLGLWLCTYAGFILRSGADRFIVAVYPNTPVSFFAGTMLLAALCAAAASYRNTARTAKLVLPAVGGVLAIVLLFALMSLRRDNLALRLPTGESAAPPLSGLARGVLGALDVLLWAVYAAALLLPELKSERFSLPRLLGALGLGCAVLALLCAELVGSFGAALTAELSWPFFSLVRNLVFFRSIERVEALAVALWVFPDYLIVSLFLRAARDCFFSSLGRRFTLFADGRVVLPLCALLALVFALTAAPDGAQLSALSDRFIPAASLFFALLFFPGLLGYGAAKGRI